MVVNKTFTAALRECDKLLQQYVARLAEIQKEVHEIVARHSQMTGAHIQVEGSIYKLYTAFSEYSHLISRKDYRINHLLEMAYRTWMQHRSGKRPSSAASLNNQQAFLQRLAALLFLNADVHKALSCLQDLHDIQTPNIFEPNSHIHQIIWTTFLSEWEGLSEALKRCRNEKAKKEPDSSILMQLLEFTELYIIALDKNISTETKTASWFTDAINECKEKIDPCMKQRKVAAQLLMQRWDKLMEEGNWGCVDDSILLTYVCWLMSVVYRHSDFLGIWDWPLGVNCLRQAVTQCQRLAKYYIKNTAITLPRLYTSGPEKEKTVIEIQSVFGMPDNFLYGCSWIGLMYELSREWMLEEFHRGMLNPNLSSLIMINSSLLLAVPIRILQTVNTAMFIIRNQSHQDTDKFHAVLKAVYKYLSEDDPSFEVGDLNDHVKPPVDVDSTVFNTCLSRSASLHSLHRSRSISASRSGHRSPSRSPSRVSAVRTFQSPARKVSQHRLFQDSDMDNLISTTAKMQLTSTPKLLFKSPSTPEPVELPAPRSVAQPQMHKLGKKGCDCVWCDMDIWNFAAAFEYRVALYLYSDKESDLMSLLDDLERIRQLTSHEQTRVMQEDKRNSRPRPPTRASDFLCALMCRHVCRKEYAAWLNKDSGIEPGNQLRIAQTLKKLVAYNSSHTIAARITANQLERLKFHPLTILHTPDALRPIWSEVEEERSGGEGSREKSSEKVAVATKEEVTAIRAAAHDYENYKLLLHRDWRFLNCLYLARAFYRSDPWRAAYYIVEASSISSRAFKQAHELSARCMQPNKRNESVTPANLLQSPCPEDQASLGVILRDANHFRKKITELDECFTLVHLFIADNGVVHLLKLNSARDPIIIPLIHYSRWAEYRAKFSKIVEVNEILAKGNGDKQLQGQQSNYWEQRKKGEAEVKAEMIILQDALFSGCAPLLLPSRPFTSEQLEFAKEIVNITDKKISFNLAKELCSAMCHTIVLWKKLVKYLLELHGCFSKSTLEKMLQVYSKVNNLRYQRAHDEDVSFQPSSDYYTFISYTPELSEFLYEMLPVFEKSPQICRLISIHSFFWTLKSLDTMPLEVNGDKGFYLLDPDNNLPESKMRFEMLLSPLNWEGVTGKSLEPAQLESAFTEKDLFIFIGHGTGQNHYLKALQSNSSRIRSSTFLMGCSSARLRPMGIGLDARSVIHDFTRRSCPCIIGTLWTVTDGEIDKYFMKMMQSIFAHSENDSVDKSMSIEDRSRKQLRYITQSMVDARSACSLKYLTGGAVVCYGVPIVAKSRIKWEMNYEEIMKECTRRKLEMEQQRQQRQEN